MRICYRAAQRACKGLLRLLAHAHSRVETERLFSLERVFRAICTFCERFYDDPVLPRSRFRALCARETLRTLRLTRPLRSDCFCFEKMRRTFLFPKLKSAIAHHLLQKSIPTSFSAAQRFSGTAFCRRKEKRAFHYAYFTAASGIDPSAPSQTAVFAVISGFAARIVSFPVRDRVSKNTRRFRALSAFEKSPLTSDISEDPFLPP